MVGDYLIIDQTQGAAYTFSGGLQLFFVFIKELLDMLYYVQDLSVAIHICIATVANQFFW